MAIIYLHGFASLGLSDKTLLLRKHFPDTKVVSPDLPVDPEQVCALIASMITSLYATGERKFMFIGTSLGGFYAWYFGAKYNSPALLVNPSLNAGESLKKRVGVNRNHGSGQDFHWLQSYNNTLEEMRQFAIQHSEPNLVEVAVALNDEVLDSAATIDHFSGSVSKVHTYDDGGHRFADFEGVLPHVGRIYEGIGGKGAS